jgi:hypothetical protein
VRGPGGARAWRPVRASRLQARIALTSLALAGRQATPMSWAVKNANWGVSSRFVTSKSRLQVRGVETATVLGHGASQQAAAVSCWVDGSPSWKPRMRRCGRARPARRRRGATMADQRAEERRGEERRGRRQAHPQLFDGDSPMRFQRDRRFKTCPRVTSGPDAGPGRVPARRRPSQPVAGPRAVRPPRCSRTAGTTTTA